MDYSNSLHPLDRKFNNLIIATLPSVINYITHSNMLNNLYSKSLFDSSAHLVISFEKYLDRLIKLFEVEPNTVIYSFILLDRITRKGIYLSLENIHKLFLISLYVGAKLVEDIIFTEKDYSDISGIPQGELAILEKEFIKMLNYDLFVTEEIFLIYTKIFDM